MLSGWLLDGICHMLYLRATVSALLSPVPAAALHSSCCAPALCYCGQYETIRYTGHSVTITRTKHPDIKVRKNFFKFSLFQLFERPFSRIRLFGVNFSWYQLHYSLMQSDFHDLSFSPMPAAAVSFTRRKYLIGSAAF